MQIWQLCGERASRDALSRMGATDRSTHGPASRCRRVRPQKFFNGIDWLKCGGKASACDLSHYLARRRRREQAPTRLTPAADASGQAQPNAPAGIHTYNQAS